MADPTIQKDYSYLIGTTHDRLTVVSVFRSNIGASNRLVGFVRCLCVCGNTKELSIGSFTRPIKVSCGCYKFEKASKGNRVKQPEYNVYNTMKARCLNSKNHNYPNYGGRGIRISSEWLIDYSFFITDMGHRPTSKHTLDRIDNNGDYTKENCRWVLMETQNTNKRNNVTAIIHGCEISGINKICDHLNINPKAFSHLYYKKKISAQKIVNNNIKI